MPSNGRQRRLVDVHEQKLLLAVRQFEHALFRADRILAVERQRQLASAFPKEPDAYRHVHRCLRRLPGGRRKALLQRESIGFPFGIVLAARFDLRRPGLRIPEAELF